MSRGGRSNDGGGKGKGVEKRGKKPNSGICSRLFNLSAEEPGTHKACD